MQSNILTPNARSFVEALRGMSYSLETAVSDIVDNSISAGATRIDIRYIDNMVPDLRMLEITDNGCGMDAEELRRAMTFCSFSPTEIRSKSDLGRFGLGLKTASISQGRKFCVYSKKKGSINAMSWDIDLLSDKWLAHTEEVTDDIADLLSGESGTIVRWMKLDRSLRLPAGPSKEDLGIVFTKLKKHLELFFHRFLNDEDSPLKITMMGRAIKGWDPFLEYDPGSPSIPFEGTWPIKSKLPSCRIKAFVLPPRANITHFGDDDYLDLQGFFVYRGKRLLTAGGWLGLKRISTAPEFRLARIRIDFNNISDTDWELDICKSKVAPPKGIRDWLALYAEKVRPLAAKYDDQVPREKKPAFIPSFWIKPKKSSLPSVNTNGPYLDAMFDALENDRLTPTVLKGFVELISVTHPSTCKSNEIFTPTEQMVAALRFLIESLSTEETPRHVVIAELRKVHPLKDWASTWAELIGK